MRGLACILIFLCLKNLVLGQPNLHFKYLNVENGLPSNTVSAIYQDHQGFMWIGSWGEGLSRYDGYGFKTYESLPDDSLTISDNSVNVIYEDSNNNLWIGTRNGINLFNRDQETFTRFLTSADNTINGFGSIFEDSHGRLWVAGKALYLYQSADSSFTAYQYSKDDQLSEDDQLASGSGWVRQILEDQNNQLWVATRNALNRYNDKNDQFTRYPAPDKLSGEIRSVCLDHSGQFWISTAREGAWIFDPAKGSYSSFYDQATIFGEYNEFIVSLFGIIQDANNHIWAVSDGSGLLLLDPESKSIYVYRYDPILNGALSDNNLISIYADHQNNLWVGSYNTGLNINNSEQGFQNRYYHNPTDPNSLSSNLVTSVYQDHKGSLWVTTDEAGINRLELDPFGNVISNTIIRSNSDILTMDKTFDLKQDQEGWIWVNTHSGSVKIHPETMEYHHYENSLLLQDRNRDYWFLVPEGLMQFNPETGISKVYPSNLFFARSLESRNGDIWISDLSEGLKVVDKESGSIITKIPGMATGICEDNNGMLWVATMKDGLIKYNPDLDEITKFKREEGFLTDDCRGGLLLDRDGQIWIGSNEGMIRFNPETNEMINFGLINENLRNYIKPIGQTSDGKIYLGSSKGMIAFDPETIEIPPLPPTPLFTNFQLFNKDVPVGENSVLKSSILETDEISLTYNQNVFTLEYTSLSYKPSQTIYSYKLDGYDEDWREVGSQRTATYTNLDAGSYDFKVRAGNLNGDWNPEEATLNITVLPPPWRTWWAYSLYAVAVCCLLLLWRSHLVRRERLKTKLQLEHLELEKVKEMDQMKTRFFANISHEFRTPLTLILGPLKQMYEGSFKGDTQAVMGVMMRNSKRLLNLINQLLDFSKLEAGAVDLQTSDEDLVKFSRTIFSAFESAARTREIKYVFQSSDQQLPLFYDHDKLEKVLINLLSNAFKFTPDGGSIILKINSKVSDPAVDKGHGVVEIAVEDSGSGISPEKLPHIFDRFYQADTSPTRNQEGTGIGLALAKELVELHFGTIDALSKPDQGSTFMVRLPLGRSHLSDEQVVIRKAYEAIDNTALEGLPLGLPPEQQAATNGELPQLLIIDDNQDMRTYLREILSASYQVQQAAHGKAGLQHAREHLPDLVISDVMMPEMDGHQLCEKLKTDERTCHIPVVLLTARAGEEAKIEGLETGADDYITKPFSPAELKARVHNLIEQRRKLREQFSRDLSINPKDIQVHSLDQRFLDRAMEILERHRSDADYSVEAYAKEIGLSRSQLHRKLKALTNQTTGEFIRSYRLKYARILLEQEYDNIAQIAYECGFKNPSYFSECFKKQFGVVPSKMIEGLKD